MATGMADETIPAFSFGDSGAGKWSDNESGSDHSDSDRRSSHSGSDDGYGGQPDSPRFTASPRAFLSGEAGAKPMLGRRKTVSGETLGRLEDVVSHPKTDEETDWLRDHLEPHYLFSHLEDFELASVVSAMEKGVYEAGEYLVKSGSWPGKFFVIKSGQVTVTEKKGHTVHLAAGEMLGDTDLMYPVQWEKEMKPMDAKVTVFTLERNAYHTIVGHACQSKRKMYEGFLEQVPFLKGLTGPEKMKMADALKPIVCEDGHYLITYGSPPSWFYIVVEGTVEVIGRKGGQQSHVCDFHSGSCVGELEFLFQHNAVADVRTKGKVRLARMSKHHFQTCIGPAEEILKRQAFNDPAYDYYRQKQGVGSKTQGQGPEGQRYDWSVAGQASGHPEDLGQYLAIRPRSMTVNSREFNLDPYLLQLEMDGLAVVPPEVHMVGLNRFSAMEEVLLKRASDLSGAQFSTSEGPAFRLMGLDKEVPDMFHMQRLGHEDRVFRDIAVNNVALELVKHVIGTEARFSAQTGIVRVPHDKGEENYGMKADQTGLPGPWSRSAFMASAVWLLTDASDEDGGLVYVPGSHQRGTGPTLPEAVNQAVQLKAPKGSLVVFHGATWHGHKPKKTEGVSLSFAVDYRHPMIIPREEFKFSFPHKLANDCADPDTFNCLIGFHDPYPYNTQTAPIPSAGKASGSPSVTFQAS